MDGLIALRRAAEAERDQLRADNDRLRQQLTALEDLIDADNLDRLRFATKFADLQVERDDLRAKRQRTVARLRDQRGHARAATALVAMGYEREATLRAERDELREILAPLVDNPWTQRRPGRWLCRFCSTPEGSAHHPDCVTRRKDALLGRLD